MKKIIRLTESDLRRIVKRSVNRIIKEESTYFDSNSLDNGITKKLISAGVKDVTNVEPEYTYNEDDYSESVTLDSVKPYLSNSGLLRLQERGCVFNWFIEFGDKTFCSRHNFDDEDIAQENCEKYVGLIRDLGGTCEARVDGIYLEDGNYLIDTCLTYEDYGNGEPFWND